jgi:TRAP-type C4-dicarboxylate transport system permease small subunit
MLLKPSRTLIVKAHLLEMFVSTGFIAAGSVMWISMNASNSPAPLLTAAALLVAGVILFGSVLKTILRY